MNVRDCYSATCHGVVKINSELVALRLLYTVMPITKFKNFKVVCFLRGVTYNERLNQSHFKYFMYF